MSMIPPLPCQDSHQDRPQRIQIDSDTRFLQAKSSNGTNASSPELDTSSTTPRSLQSYIVSPQDLTAALSGHRQDVQGASPFFVDWEQKIANSGLSELDATVQTRAPEPSTLPLLSSSGRNYSHMSVDSAHTSLYTPDLASTSSSSRPTSDLVDRAFALSPLPASATMPSTPMLANAPTPVFTPPPSVAGASTHVHDTISTAVYSKPVHIGMNVAVEIELPEPSSILLNSKGSLPLPGDPVEDGEYPASRPSLSGATRSDSNYSISSTLNDAGHDAVISPPKQALPSPIRRPLPVPPNKHPSDPPLIPSLRRPEVLQLSQEDKTLPERPISPFSPTSRIASSNETQRPALPLSRLSREADEIDLDLIDFDSDNDQELAAYVNGGESGSAAYAGLSDSENSSGGEEEDFDSHLLYSTLTKSGSPYVRRAWEESKIVLLPPKYALPGTFTASDKQYDFEASGAGPKEWERFTALHALRQQTGSPDLFVGYGKTADGRRLQARLDAERGEVEVTLQNEDTSAGDLNERKEILRSFSNNLGQSLRRTDTIETSTSSAGGGHALPPHLFISSSPSSSADSSNFPLTPPVSPPIRPIGGPVRSASDSFRTSTSTSDSVMFPSMEPALASMSKMPLSPTRRLQIVGETPVYRRKKTVAAGVASSAPSAIPSPPGQTQGPAAQQSIEPQGQNPNRLSTLTTTSSSSLFNSARGVKKKDSKVRLRVPKWLGGRKESGSFSHQGNSIGQKPTSIESAPTTPLETQSLQQLVVPEEIQLVIEKVRIIRVDGYVVDWPGEPILSPPAHQMQNMQRRSTQALQQYKSRQVNVPASSSASSVMPSRQSSNASKVSRKSSNALRYRHSNTSGASLVLRDFSSDIAFLLDPPKHLGHLAGVFEQALRTVIRLTSDMAATLPFVQGYEAYTKERLRAGILDVVCTLLDDVQDISSSQRERLTETFENVIMAFLHNRIYQQSIQPVYQEEDLALQMHIDAYSTVTIPDFGIPTFEDASLLPAIEAMADAVGSGSSKQELWERLSPQVYKKLVQTISETTNSASTVIALLEARTPLDCASQLRRVIDEVVKAADTGKADASRNSLAADDIIPLLSWIVVKASAKNLESLLFYTKTFRLAETSQGDLDWAIVQFEAAVAFLRTDPLNLVVKVPERASSPAIYAHSPPSAMPGYPRSNSQESVDASLRGRRASLQSLPADQRRYQGRSHLSSGGLSGHKRTISSLPATRIVTYAASGRPSSIVSTVTTEESGVEDNPEMGPPAVPKRETRTSTDEGHSRPDLSLLSNSRHRSTSSYSLASTELQIRPQLLRPVPSRQATRSFHISQNLDSDTVNQPTRIPLNRSQTTPYNIARPPSASALQASSTDLQRSGSENSKRTSGSWWGPLAYAKTAVPPTSPPPGSEYANSSRPSSPASPAMRAIEAANSERGSFDMDRSSAEVGWLEWGRKRLSSMTSATSLAEIADGPPKTVAELVAEKLAASAAAQPMRSASRPRRNSESATSILSSPPQSEGAFSDKPSEFGLSPGNIGAGARSLTYTSGRPKSTISLSSQSSLETESSAGRTHLGSSPGMIRSATHSSFRNSMSGPPSSGSLARSRRFRNEARSANLASNLALPQLQLDTASVTSSGSMSGANAAAFAQRRSPNAFDKNPYSSYMQSYTPQSRLGTTPFSPIEEVSSMTTPSPDAPKANSYEMEGPNSVPPTPRGGSFASHIPTSTTSNTITNLT